MTWQSETLSVNGLRMHVTRTGGDKPAFVALHGRTANGLLWTSTARLLQAHFDVIMPDLRGHGLSDAPASGYDHATMADDVLGLMDALDIGHAVLMGGSMGAALATRIAAQHPERVDRLVLHLACWVSQAQRAPAYVQRKIARKRAQFRAWNATALLALVEQVRMFSTGWADDDIQRAAQAWQQVHENAAQTFAHDLSKAAWRGLVKAARCPILALMGRQEPGHATTRAFCENELPDCTFAPLKGGHTAMYGDFEMYAKHLNVFLKTKTSPEST